MRKILRHGFIFLPALSLLLLPAAAYAQVIIIDNVSVCHYVQGNGKLPYGKAPDLDDEKWTISPSNNTVEIKTGGFVMDDVEVYGGYSDDIVVHDTENEKNIDAKNNRVTVRGTVEGNVYGGFTFDVGGSAIGNTVVIDGTVLGNVYGGGSESGGSSDSGDAVNNTVRITGSPVVSGILYGGETEDGISEGNTLLLESAITVAGLRDFQILSFALPDGTKNGDVMLSVIEMEAQGDTPDSYYGEAVIDGATVKIRGDFSSLGIGDKITLIDAEKNLEGEPANRYARRRGFEFHIAKEGGKLVATLEDRPDTGGCNASGMFGLLSLILLYALKHRSGKPGK